MTRGLFFYLIAMAVTRAKKEEVLKNLSDKFGKAKAIYFSDYRGLTVKEVGQLRKQLREHGVDYYVAKKTLMYLSAKNANMPEIPKDIMDGPVGAAFGYDDVVVPVKTIHTFAKGAEKLNILGGFVDGKYITKAEAMELAELPSREELLAKLVGSMNSPISGFHGVLHGLLRNFVGTLQAVSEKKGAE